MKYSVVLDRRALKDIQESKDFYNSILKSLGDKFISEFSHCVTTLEKNPFYQIRYDDVRCLPLRKFPFLIHFSVDEDKQIVKIYAVLHTSRDTENWKFPQ